eukprot:Skav225933  [mRNA]  locus=scaffold1500:374337:375412:- [translate_table: standard]
MAGGGAGGGGGGWVDGDGYGWYMGIWLGEGTWTWSLFGMIWIAFEWVAWTRVRDRRGLVTGESLFPEIRHSAKLPHDTAAELKSTMQALAEIAGYGTTFPEALVA